MQTRKLTQLITVVAATAISTMTYGQSFGTAFTYQGELMLNGQPVTQACDVQFSLWSRQSDMDPNFQIGPTLIFDGQGGNPDPVTPANGRFSVELDFGSGAFTGRARWLQIDLCCPSPCSGSYSTLTPRQKINPTPHALALPALHVYLNPQSPNVIAGYHENVANPLAAGVTISGGGRPSLHNSVYDDWSTIGGGAGNVAGIDDDNPTGGYATIAGGYQNIARIDGTTVGGGRENNALSTFCTVSGGRGNQAGLESEGNGTGAAILGGLNNTSSGYVSSVLGGVSNVASGSYSVAAGGRNNRAEGDYSFAAGARAVAGTGMFVWADATSNDFPSASESNFTPMAHQFLVRSHNGVVFVTATDGSGNSTAGAKLPAGGGSWSSMSDRNAKQVFSPVDAREILKRLQAMPISTWSYKAQDGSIRHIGPMAQDFYGAFGVGEDEKFITSIDADGVALAAIQGLCEVIDEKDAQIKALEVRIHRIEAILDQPRIQDSK